MRGCREREEENLPKQVKDYVTFRVRGEAAPAMAPLFSELESRRSELGVTDVQLSLSSLEEVYLEVIKVEEGEGRRRGKRRRRLIMLTISLNEAHGNGFCQ